MTTNGTRNGTDTKSPGCADEASIPNGQSVEGRLEALRQTIRTWDWRAAVVEVGPSPADVAATTAPPPTTTIFTEVHEDSEALVRDPSPLQGIEDTQPLVDRANTAFRRGCSAYRGAHSPRGSGRTAHRDSCTIDRSRCEEAVDAAVETSIRP